MDRFTSILISSLAMLTALVVLAKSVVEYKSARAKAETEKQTPTAVTPISIASHQRFNRLVIWFRVFALISSLATLMWLAIGPLQNQPATLAHVAIVGLCVTNIIQATRWD